MKNAIVLCSGGMDSVTTAYYVKKSLGYRNIVVLFFDYGQLSLISEKKFSRTCADVIGAEFISLKLDFLKKVYKTIVNKDKIAHAVKRFDLKNSGKESEKWYFPSRNLIFLSFAISLAENLYVKDKEKYDIFVGFKCEGNDSYPDTTKDFVNRLNSLIRSSTKGKFKIISPLIEKDKEDIVLFGGNLGVDFKKTLSCYTGNFHCGHCLACRLRQEGFYWANYKDPTKYIKKMKDFRIA